MKKFGVYCLAILQALAGCTVGMYLAPQMAKKTVSADMEGFLLLAGINALMTALVLFFAVWAVQLTLGRQCAFLGLCKGMWDGIKNILLFLPCALAVSAACGLLAMGGQALLGGVLAPAQLQFLLEHAIGGLALLLLPLPLHLWFECALTCQGPGKALKRAWRTLNTKYAGLLLVAALCYAAQAASALICGAAVPEPWRQTVRLVLTVLWGAAFFAGALRLYTRGGEAPVSAAG